MSIALVPCKCVNEFQDKKYGKGVRVANRTEKGPVPNGRKKVRCTVCSAEHEVSESSLKA